jgi:hypothetical protein
MAITPAEWNKLSEKAQWDIKVALRGPDTYRAETMKWFTTGVIRGRCRKAFRVGGSVNPDLKLVVLPDGYQKTKDAPNAWNSGHFLDHIQTAAAWLNVPVLFVPMDAWYAATQIDSIRIAGAELVKAAASTSDPELIAELKRHLKSGLV